MRKAGAIALTISLALRAFLAVPIFSRNADATNFLCADVKAISEKPICGDLLGKKVSAAYRAVFQSLSEAGRAEFHNEQREWLKYTQIVCLTHSTESDTYRSVNCLRDLYKQRRERLDGALVKSGNMVIRRVDRFSVASSVGPGSGGLNAGFNTTTVSFPQIDEPRNEHERTWNRLIAQHEIAGQPIATVSAKASASAEDDWDVSVNYVLGSVSSNAISLRFVIYDDAHGAHGWGSDEGITWLLHEDRGLRAQDVFEADQSWSKVLARLVIEQIRRKAGDNVPVLEWPDIVERVSDPAHWLIKPRALVIRFVIEDAPSCCSTVEAAISWRKLNPYLRSPLPFSAKVD